MLATVTAEFGGGGIVLGIRQQPGPAQQSVVPLLSHPQGGGGHPTPFPLDFLGFQSIHGSGTVGWTAASPPAVANCLRGPRAAALSRTPAGQTGPGRVVHGSEQPRGQWRQGVQEGRVIRLAETLRANFVFHKIILMMLSLVSEALEEANHPRNTPPKICFL